MPLILKPKRDDWLHHARANRGIVEFWLERREDWSGQNLCGPVATRLYYSLYQGIVAAHCAQGRTWTDLDSEAKRWNHSLILRSVKNAERLKLLPPERTERGVFEDLRVFVNEMHDMRLDADYCVGRVPESRLLRAYETYGSLLDRLHVPA